MFLSVAVRKMKAKYLKINISEHRYPRSSQVNCMALSTIPTISGCFAFALMVGFPGLYLMGLGIELGLRGPPADKAAPCLPDNAQGLRPIPSSGVTRASKQGACILPSQEPELTFGNFGACTVGLLLRPEICIKGLRKIYLKINMKAKTSCQELQPHTSCWLVL
uniref:Uncharacterized protein n=1 Tax=Macaca fascicularis TaxID=9541 RepID=Q9GM20_MACFA|nr:hypothetical protein [Macaca fascicularis]